METGTKVYIVLMVIALALVIIGAINWGLIGAFNNNLVSSVNAATFKNEYLERTIYAAVAIAGFVLLGGVIYGYAKRCDLYSDMRVMCALKQRSY